MKVILLEDVKSLGKKGQIVNVSDGYARNLLLPKKLGVEATGKNMNDLKLQKAHEDKVAQENLDAAKAFAEELKDKQVDVGIKVGEGGRTFGSISAKEIAEAAKAQLGYELDKKKLQLSAPIKELGTTMVPIKLHPKVTGELKVVVKKHRRNSSVEEELIKRILPHSDDAERSVIGCMMMNREAIMIASEILNGDEFYRQQMGIVFDSMVELYNEGKPVDFVTLPEKLKEKDVPPEISSMEFAKDLLTAVPTSANVGHYAKIVREKAMLRRLIKMNEDIANTCYLDKEPGEEIMEDTEKQLFQLLQTRTGGDYVPIRQVVLNALETIEKASQTKGTVTGIPTGFVDLDYKTSGLQPSDFILVAARPSMGKTAFVLNMAQYMAFRKDKSVAIFSLEMSKEQLVNRLFSLESKVDSQKIRTGSLEDEDWAKLIEGAGVIGNSA